ncbi:hypothetical protein J2X54_003507 [Duganella sp. 3397]|nr:hypothetical protein [Duganella sp. 3397]
MEVKTRAGVCLLIHGYKRFPLVKQKLKLPDEKRNDNDSHYKVNDRLVIVH